MEIPTEYLKTDVLVLGGGLGGCMAAIKASELGVKVTIVEKAALRRAGGGVVGLHRTLAIHPDYNVTFEEFARKNAEWGGGVVSEGLSYTVAHDSLDRIRDLESWGIKFRDSEGQYKFEDGRDIAPIPGIVIRPFAGTDLQPGLAAEVRRRNIQVLERTTLTKILTEGGRVGGKVIGATVMNTRDGRFTVIKAKSICICSGGCYRIYRQSNSSYAPDRLRKIMGTKVGEGVIAAYKAGAEIINYEFAEGPHRGLKDWDLVGSAYIIHWSKGEPVDGLGNKLPQRQTGFDALKLEVVEGRGPVFYDLRGIPDELKARVEEGRKAENQFGNDLYMNGRRIDIWKEPIEFEVRRDAFLHSGQAGLGIDTQAKTNIEGLYAAGDAIGGGYRYSSMGAWVFGARAGTHSAEYALTAAEPEMDMAEVEAERRRVYAPATANGIYEWFELEDKVRKIVSDYAFYMRNEGKLLWGLKRLDEIKERFLLQVIAKTPRDLMRFLEVECLFDVAELHMRAALFRKESRIMPTSFHYRVDFPERDDTKWKKQSVIQNVEGEIRITLREPLPM